MAVSTVHPDYSWWCEIWRKCRDAVAGEEWIKQRDDSKRILSSLSSVPESVRYQRYYLPQLEGQSNFAYDGYKKRAEWYNASGRTVAGLVGAAFRRWPKPAVPQAIEDLLDNIDLRGQSFGLVAKTLLEELLTVGRGGLLVDMTPDGGRPYLVAWKAEQICNWRTEIIDGQEVTTLVVLGVTYQEAKPGDIFETEERQRRVVLRLEDSVYVHEVYEQGDTEGDFVLASQTVPTIGGVPLSEIPFMFLNGTNLRAEISKPPALDLVNVNLHHYILSAEKRNALKFAGFPLLYRKGSFTEDKPLYLGAEEGVDLGPDGEVGYAETSGAAIALLDQEMQRDEARMVLLGSRLLRAEKREAETAEAMRLAQTGENATLADVVTTLDDGLTTALTLMAEWLQTETEGIEAGLNTDFVDTAMSAADALAWTQVMQAGGISREALYHLLREGERLPEDLELEAYLEQLDQDQMRAATMNAAMQATMPDDEDEDEEDEDGGAQDTEQE